jgi:hypothetical protein
MATHIKIEVTDGATAASLREAATACGMSLRGYVLHAATQHARGLLRGGGNNTQPTPAGTAHAYTPAQPYTPLVVPVGTGDATMRCLCCGRVLPAQRCIVQHLLSHVVRGEVEAQIHSRGDGGRYVVYVDAEGRQF